jgi:hypothetical protein
MKQRNVESRRGAKSKGPHSEDANNDGFEMRQISASIGCEREGKEALSPMHHRMLKLINLSFVSQTEDCIKIRDFAEEDKAPNSAKLPSSKNKLVLHPSAGGQPTHRKVQDFLTTGSFSPVKSSTKKRSIINFPKLSEIKNPVQYASLKKTQPAQKVEQQEIVDKGGSRSPSRRPDSSRKYVRASVPDQAPFRVFKS